MLNIFYTPLILPDFDKKLAAMGFEISDGGANYNFHQGNQNQPKGAASQSSDQSSGGDQELTQSTAQKLGQRNPSSATKQPSSIYRLVSKKSSEAEKPVIQKHASSSSLKKVTFRDSNSSTESELSTDVVGTETGDETYDELDHDRQPEEIQSETQESFDDSYESNDDSSIPESYKGSREKQDLPAQHPKLSATDEEDDVSMSAFVPASVRRESILPNRPYNDTSSLTSEDSFDYDHKTECRPLSPHHIGQASGHGSNESDYQSGQGRSTGYQSKNYGDQSTDESDEEGHEGEIDDLLDEAMDEVPEVQMRPKKGEPVAAPVSTKVIWL